MGIQYHPEQGTILICDFKGLNTPEMTKRRPVIVVSPTFKSRTRLCTVVPLSTTAPIKVELYHYKLQISPPLPAPYSSSYAWVKADMLYTVAFDRLSLPYIKKNGSGEREYDIRIIQQPDLIKVQECMMFGLGLNALTS